MTQALTIQAFQDQTDEWFDAAFASHPQFAEIGGVNERAIRFFEESTELVQYFDIPVDKLVHTLLTVYDKPVETDPTIEMGGVMVTLAQLCTAAEFNLGPCARDELVRAYTLLPKIHARADAKIASGTSLGATPRDRILRFALETVLVYLIELREAGEHPLVLDCAVGNAEDTLRTLLTELHHE